MLVRLKVEDDAELRAHVRDLIKGQVKAIIREEIKTLVDEEIKGILRGGFIKRLEAIIENQVKQDVNIALGKEFAFTTSDVVKTQLDKAILQGTEQLIKEKETYISNSVVTNLTVSISKDDVLLTIIKRLTK